MHWPIDHQCIIIANDNTRQCDYEGMACLDRTDLVFPQTTIMQPWRNGLVCDYCLPSCNEHEIKLIGRSYSYVVFVISINFLHEILIELITIWFGILICNAMQK